MKTRVAAPAPIAIASFRPEKIELQRRRGRAGLLPRGRSTRRRGATASCDERDQRRRSRRRPGERASCRHPPPGHHRSAGPTRKPIERADSTRPFAAPSDRGPASSGTRANSAAWPIAAPAPRSTVSTSTSRDRAAAEGEYGDDRRIARGPRRSRPRASRAGRRADRRVRRARRPGTRARSGGWRRRSRASTSVAAARASGRRPSRRSTRRRSRLRRCGDHEAEPPQSEYRTPLYERTFGR